MFLRIKDENGNWVPISVIKGDPGENYILTEEDKKEIAGMVEVEGADIDLSDYALKSEIPSTVGLASEDYVAEYVGEAIADLDIPTDYTTMGAVEAKGYQTAAQVQALINASIPTYTDGDEVSY